MKLEDLEIIEVVTNYKATEYKPQYFKIDDVTKLYNYQQNKIELLENKLLNISIVIKELNNLLKKRKKELASYEDTDEDYYNYMEGEIQSLEIILNKLNKF